MRLFLVVCPLEFLCCLALREDTAGPAHPDIFPPPFPQAAQGGGHRTLLYGHAILLRHSFSGMVSTFGCLLSPFKEEGEDGEGRKYRKPISV